MDIVYIHDLHIETTIGVFDWERRIRQTLVIDLDVGNDNRRAASKDDLADTIDYGAVANRVRGFVEASEFQLVETLAERIAEILLSEFRLPWLRLKISKQGAVRGVRDVGVIIERGQR
jgi:7,8-dihydroneopterin aldolase/epimerase/oxygenase